VVIVVEEAAQVGADVTFLVNGTGTCCSGVILNVSVSCVNEVPNCANGPL